MELAYVHSIAYVIYDGFVSKVLMSELTVLDSAELERWKEVWEEVKILPTGMWTVMWARGTLLPKTWDRLLGEVAYNVALALQSHALDKVYPGGNAGVDNDVVARVTVKTMAFWGMCPVAGPKLKAKGIAVLCNAQMKADLDNRGRKGQRGKKGTKAKGSTAKKGTKAKDSAGKKGQKETKAKDSTAA
ncbi:unnamed protein product [Closterium sp. NIES-64]|nr:unnamed protein product [Closterium sp. NIES-64]